MNITRITIKKTYSTGRIETDTFGYALDIKKPRTQSQDEVFVSYLKSSDMVWPKRERFQEQFKELPVRDRIGIRLDLGSNIVELKAITELGQWLVKDTKRRVA